MTDDLIGRAEAQTAIQFAARKYTVAHEKHGEGQVVWSDNLINVTDAMNVLRDLPSAQPKQRWIPVSERLPENDDKVLITHSHGVSMAWWNGRCWTGAMVKKYFTVKAWMPLPEPYQEGGAE